jgi:hypothetical protein
MRHAAVQSARAGGGSFREAASGGACPLDGPFAGPGPPPTIRSIAAGKPRARAATIGSPVGPRQHARPQALCRARGGRWRGPARLRAWGWGSVCAVHRWAGLAVGSVYVCTAQAQAPGPRPGQQKAKGGRATAARHRDGVSSRRQGGLHAVFQARCGMRRRWGPNAGARAGRVAPLSRGPCGAPWGGAGRRGLGPVPRGFWCATRRCALILRAACIMGGPVLLWSDLLFGMVCGAIVTWSG